MQKRRDAMFVYFLHGSGPDDVYRASTVLEGIDPDELRVVSNLRAPAGLADRWLQVTGDETAAARAVAAADPKVLVVDAPAEVARPVIAGSRARLAVVARPGGGHHGEEGALYDGADLILAPWGEGLDSWPSGWRDRTVYLGLLAAALDQQLHCRPQPASGAIRQWRCVVLSGHSSGPTPRERRDILAATPGWTWFYAREEELAYAAPVWHHLARADVVVCLPHAPALAAVAAAGLASVVVQPGRPTSSQRALASMVHGAGAGIVVDSWSRVDAWPGLLNQARELGGDRWSAFLVEKPGLRAAEALTRLAGQRGTRPRQSASVLSALS